MVALTRDFHIVASRHATRFSAVFVSISYIAQAWDVGALFRLLIRHFISSFPSRPLCCSRKRNVTFDVAPFPAHPGEMRDLPQGGLVSATTSFRIMHADFQTSGRCKLLFSKVVGERCERPYRPAVSTG
jgi:hypothetical protein